MVIKKLEEIKIGDLYKVWSQTKRANDSDDCIEVEDLSETGFSDEEYASSDNEGFVRIKSSNETALQNSFTDIFHLKYSENGIWKITHQTKSGNLKVHIEECLEETKGNYSDKCYVEGDIMKVRIYK